MTDMTILHFVQREGNGEYVVFTDVYADPSDWERPGYKIHQIIDLKNFPSHTLPIESTMLKDD